MYSPLNQARARAGEEKNGSSLTSPRDALGSASLVPSGTLTLPSACCSTGPSGTSTRKICASISARVKAARANGSEAARTRRRSISFSGSNMKWPWNGLPRGKFRAAKNSGCLRQRSLGLGESPVDPLRQQLDVLGFHGGAAPDAQTRRRIAIMREIEAGVLLLDQRDQLLGEVGLRIGRKRS